jgi:hypothetical protein
VGKYIQSLRDEKKLSAIVQVANAAINYAEDLDRRGDLDNILSGLDLPQRYLRPHSIGIKKLYVAGKWVEDELNRMGIEMTDKEAQRWVAAEFQNRVTGLSLTPERLAHIQEIWPLLQNLDQDKLAALSTLGSSQATFGDEPSRQQDPLPVEPDTSTTEVEPDTSTTEIEPDASTTEVEPDTSTTEVEPDASTKEVEPDHPSQDQVVGSEPTLENNLAVLAQQAIDYVETLKATRELAVPERDIAIAWMLTEVTKQGLNVTPDQIAREFHQALIEFETSS